MMDKDLLEEMKIEMGNRIRSCRKDAGMSQETLAEKANLSPHQLSNIERGKSLIKVHNLICIADILGASIDYLTCRTDNTASAEVQWELMESKLESEEKEIVSKIVRDVLKLAYMKNDK